MVHLFFVMVGRIMVLLFHFSPYATCNSSERSFAVGFWFNLLWCFFVVTD